MKIIKVKHYHKKKGQKVRAHNRRIKKVRKTLYLPMLVANPNIDLSEYGVISGANLFIPEKPIEIITPRLGNDEFAAKKYMERFEHAKTRFQGQRTRPNDIVKSIHYRRISPVELEKRNLEEEYSAAMSNVNNPPKDSTPEEIRNMINYAEGIASNYKLKFKQEIPKKTVVFKNGKAVTS